MEKFKKKAVTEAVSVNLTLTPKEASDPAPNQVNLTQDVSEVLIHLVLTLLMVDLEAVVVDPAEVVVMEDILAMCNVRYALSMVILLHLTGIGLVRSEL